LLVLEKSSETMAVADHMFAALNAVVEKQLGAWGKGAGWGKGVHSTHVIKNTTSE